ncbi:MAG: signal peptidase II [Chitinispirillaceae bacterium]|nr:signal peptidase II [Chitinispirillaceae bacterium]
MSKVIQHRWALLVMVTAVGFLIDWWTKYLAVRNLSTYEPLRLAGDWLELILVYNKGAVFGLDPRQIIPGFPVNLFFTVFHVAAVIILTVYYRFMKSADRLMLWALAVILPGALGNLFDRVMHQAQGVVDFIKMDFGFWPFNPWPVYNMADAFVTVGVCLMIVAFIFEDRNRKKQTAV